MNNGDKIYKSLLKCTSVVSGFYKFSDVFQIYPYYGELHSEKHFYIEYNFKYKSISCDMKKKLNKYSELQKNIFYNRFHLVFLKEIVNLLSIAMNERIELSFNSGEDFFPQEQNSIDEFSDISRFLEINKSDFVIYKEQRYNDQFIKIQSDADIMFGNYFKMDVKSRDKIFASTSLYNKAEEIFVKFASMAVVAYASSIENLVDFDDKEKKIKCSKCGQVEYRSTQKFRDFLYLYCGNKNEYEKIIRKNFYSDRSRIVHSGFLLGIDVDQTVFDVCEYELIGKFSAIVRSSIFNYIVNMKMDKA